MPVPRHSWAALCTVATGCGPRVEGVEPLRRAASTVLRADSLERLSGVVFVDARGDSIHAILRETGREAASVIPGPLGVVALAVEYPQVQQAEPLHLPAEAGAVASAPGFCTAKRLRTRSERPPSW